MMAPVLLLMAIAAAAYAFLNAGGISQAWPVDSGRTVSITSGALHVIDGDTVRFNGERLRLLVIDAPEIHSPRCAAEHQAGLEAKAALVGFLAHRLVEVQFSGRRDVFGRPLVTLAVNGNDAGIIVSGIEQGLSALALVLGLTIQRTYLDYEYVIEPVPGARLGLDVISLPGGGMALASLQL